MNSMHNVEKYIIATSFLSDESLSKTDYDDDATRHPMTKTANALSIQKLKIAVITARYHSYRERGKI